MAHFALCSYESRHDLVANLSEIEKEPACKPANKRDVFPGIQFPDIVLVVNLVMNELPSSDPLINSIQVPIDTLHQNGQGMIGTLMFGIEIPVGVFNRH